MVCLEHPYEKLCRWRPVVGDQRRRLASNGRREHHGFNIPTLLGNIILTMRVAICV